VAVSFIGGGNQRGTLSIRRNSHIFNNIHFM
jgi:hypothetical protein